MPRNLLKAPLNENIKEFLNDVLDAKNEIMKHLVLNHTSSSSEKGDRSLDDFQKLLDLKQRVKKMAQVVSSSHSIYSISDNKNEETNLYFQEIFEQLMMVHSEVDFAIQIISNAAKGELKKDFAMFFSDLCADTCEPVKNAASSRSMS